MKNKRLMTLIKNIVLSVIGFILLCVVLNFILGMFLPDTSRIGWVFILGIIIFSIVPKAIKQYLDKNES